MSGRGDDEFILFGAFSDRNASCSMIPNSYGNNESVDIAKISRKRLKPGQTRTRERKSTQRARRKLSKVKNGQLKSTFGQLKVYTSPITLIGGDPRKNDTVDMKEAQGNKAYTLEVLTKEAQPVTIMDCHAGNPCELEIDLTAKSSSPIIEGIIAISELQKMTEAKGDGGEALYVRGRSGQIDMEQGKDSAWSKSQGRSSRLRCYICQSKEHLKRDCPRYNHKKSQSFVRNEDQVLSFGADRYDTADVMMAMSVEELLDWIMDSGSSYYITYRRDYLVDFKEFDGGNILLGDGRECCVRGTGKVQVQMRDGSSFVLDNVRYVSELRRNLISLDGQAVTRKTLKGRKQLREYQTEWKIKTGNVLDSCNQRSIQQFTKSGSGLSKVLWAEDTTMSTYLVNMSPSSAIGFKTPIDMLGFFGWLASIKQGMLELVKVKCIFLGYHKGIVGNKLWRLDDVTSKVLQGVEFEVEPQEDHTFEVEPHGNVDHVVGSQEVQTQDLIYYHSARDREQHSAWELFSYKEDSNEAAFAWKAVLKDDMDARSDVYVLSNGYRKCSDDSDGYYWEYTPDRRTGFVDFDYTMGRSITVMVPYMTLTEAVKEAIWLKGLAIESRFELKIVAGIDTHALSKAILGPRFQHSARVEILRVARRAMARILGDIQATYKIARSQI
ncbi:zinc finger, CCHC-type containing protein [Tanacetum coccineum]